MKSIFVVDDEIPILEWLTMCVHAFDPTIQVSTFCNGEEALSAISRQRPDLVITDVAMPKMNGIDLLESIKQNNTSPDVIIMSGHQDFEYARASLKFGAVDYILKSEINQKSIFALLQKIRQSRARKSRTMPDGSDVIQNQVLKTAYLKKLLSENIPCTLEDLRANSIRLQNAPFFVIVLSNHEEAISALDGIKSPAMEQREWIQLENILVFVANTSDSTAPEQLVYALQQILGDCTSIGYSPLYPSIQYLPQAVRQARTMRDCQFFKADHVTTAPLPEEACKKINLRLFELYSDVVNQYKVLGSDSLHSGVQEFMQYIKQLQCYDVEYIKKTACRMLEGIYHHTEDSALSIEAQKSKVYGAKSIHELEDVLLKLCEKIPPRHHYSESIEKVIAYLHTHYQQQLSLCDVASHIHLSEEYLSRLFRKEVGKTFTDYLNAFRMQEAMRLLKSTNLRISDVCEAVGISNSKYFSLLFKKYFGISPSQTRE